MHATFSCYNTIPNMREKVYDIVNKHAIIYIVAGLLFYIAITLSIDLKLQ